MSSCSLQAGGLGSTGVSHSARTAWTSTNPFGNGTAKPDCHPEPLSLWVSDSLHRSHSHFSGWPMFSTFIFFLYISFFNPTVWHWSFHLCCKFLIDDSLSGSTLSQLWGSWPYPYIIYFICKCFINIQALVVSWGSQCASVISVAVSSFGCVKEKVFLF